MNEVGEMPMLGSHRFHCIHDDEPLEFEKDPLAPDNKI